MSVHYLQAVSRAISSTLILRSDQKVYPLYFLSPSLNRIDPTCSHCGFAHASHICFDDYTHTNILHVLPLCLTFPEQHIGIPREAKPAQLTLARTPLPPSNLTSYVITIRASNAFISMAAKYRPGLLTENKEFMRRRRKRGVRPTMRDAQVQKPNV